jgi:DNA-binding FadR family transcriptional regulator
MAELPFGQQLLELEVAKAMSCSQSTVREALMRLQEDGLIVRQGYRGISTLLLSADIIWPHQPNPTAWMPTVPFHRFDHMRRLYRLLSQLEPGVQATRAPSARGR